MFARFTQILTIELTMIGEGSYRCSFALVNQKGDSIDTADYTTGEGSLVKVIEKLPRNFPTAITLNGKGIVHRQMNELKREDEKLFVQAFPALEKKDFYVQQVRADQFAYISLVRRTFADDLLGKLRSAGIPVYLLALGGLAVVSIWDSIEHKEKRLSLGGHIFEISTDLRPLAYQYLQEDVAPEKIKFAGAELSTALALPYALAFQLFMHGQIMPVSTEHEGLTADLNAFLENAKLKRIGAYFVFGLLGLLLISFLLLMHFNRENYSLSERVGQLTATADQTDLLKREVGDQEAMLFSLGWNGGYNRAFLLAEIGESKPIALTLKEISFRPAQEKLREPGTTIYLKGETGNLTTINNWLFILKEKKWVLDVSLLRYQQDNDNGHFSFDLIIKY